VIGTGRGTEIGS